MPQEAVRLDSPGNGDASKTTPSHRGVVGAPLEREWPDSRWEEKLLVPPTRAHPTSSQGSCLAACPGGQPDSSHSWLSCSPVGAHSLLVPMRLLFCVLLL